MSRKLEAILEDILKEQKLTSFFTLTLESDRLLAALLESGLGVPVLVANEFNVAPGATQTNIAMVPSGFVYIIGGKFEWWTSLPWWCRWDNWMDQTAPAPPALSVIRTPGNLSMPAFAGVVGIRAFLLGQVTNNHATETAYCLVMNYFIAVETPVWDMIKSVYLDPVVDEVRKRALEVSGLMR